MPVLVDVIISFALIFLLFSILVSGMAELWQLIIRKRALFLHDAINDVFNDHLNKNYAHLIYTHPLVDRLKEKNTTYPHYIAAGTFADALIDIIRNDHQLPEITFNHERKSYDIKHAVYSSDQAKAGDGIVADFNAGIHAMAESDLKQLLRTVSFGADDYASLKRNVVQWFNDYMSATSTWYKRGMTKMLFGFGIIVALVFNVNAIHIVKELYDQKVMRDELVNYAKEYVAKNKEFYDGEKMQNIPIDLQVQRIQEAYKESRALNLPVGWRLKDMTNRYDLLGMTTDIILYLLMSIPGWLIAAAALSYGADNWFNILSRFINIRTSIKPKE